MPNDFLKILEYTEVVMEMLLLEVSIEKNKDKVEILLTFILSLENMLDKGRQFCEPIIDKGRYENLVKKMDDLRNKMQVEIEKSDKNLAFEIAWNNLNRVSRFLGLPERVLVK